MYPIVPGSGCLGMFAHFTPPVDTTIFRAGREREEPLREGAIRSSTVLQFFEFFWAPKCMQIEARKEGFYHKQSPFARLCQGKRAHAPASIWSRSKSVEVSTLSITALVESSDGGVPPSLSQMPKKSKGSGKKAADEKKPAEESDEAAAPAAPVEDVAEPEEKTEGEAAPEAVGTVGEGEAPAAEAAAAEVEAAAEAPTAVEDAVKGAEGGGENDVEDAGGEGGSEAAPSPSDKGEGAGGAEEEGKGQEEAAAAVEAAPAPEEAPSAGAAGGEEVAAGAERTLRDDSECFIADYTKSGAGQVTPEDRPISRGAKNSWNRRCGVPDLPWSLSDSLGGGLTISLLAGQLYGVLGKQAEDNHQPWDVAQIVS